MHCTPTGHWDAHPRTRASQEPTNHHQRKNGRRWKGSSPETLKRLAISIFQRRSFLPSSTLLSVMAAILRASVRRAMVGLMPLVSDRW